MAGFFFGSKGISMYAFCSGMTIHDLFLSCLMIAYSEPFFVSMRYLFPLTYNLPVCFCSPSLVTISAESSKAAA